MSYGFEPTHLVLEDRAIGSLIGLAAGDAVGTTLEFSARDSRPHLTDMLGGGPFGLKAGQWTDDTSMALCLADSLIDCGELKQRDLMERFVRWYRNGENSCTGACFDIGIATASALHRFEQTGNPEAGRTDPMAAGNGSLMRLAPVAIRWYAEPEVAIAVARAQSKTTHGAAEAVDACAYFANLLVRAIHGIPKADVLLKTTFDGVLKVADIASGSWRTKARDEISSSGYVIHTLEAAIWCVERSKTFEDAVLLAANLGEDADTVAAVTGQLAGALWGLSSVPKHWRRRLAWSDRIVALARHLYVAGQQNRGPS
jgi:ADP-ribosyl-[dinitrogen reductase] hydrolase